MKYFRAHIEDVARAPGAVLIVGESGTGKELVAEAIHQYGDFCDQPFIAVNCAALPRELIESELFGYERGAFTGSRDAAPGLLRAAGHGTVFLDEITEMPLPLQAKLLRALEQRAVRPVGGVREVPIHARIVAATNVDPERDGDASALRRDLYYRLCVHRIDVPALRERVEDIPLLVEHFLDEIRRQGHRAPRGFSSESLQVLSHHRFSGNVRELRNVVEHTCATCKGEWVEPAHLPPRLAHGPSTPSLPADPSARAASLSVRAPSLAASAPPSSDASAPRLEGLELRHVERRHIEHVLELTHGNKAQAARALGLSRHQLYLKLERYGLTTPSE